MLLAVITDFSVSTNASAPRYLRFPRKNKCFRPRTVPTREKQQENFYQRSSIVMISPLLRTTPDPSVPSSKYAGDFDGEGGEGDAGAQEPM